MKKIKVIREKTGEEVMNDRMDVIGQNGNEGLHYGEVNTAISFISNNFPFSAKSS